MQKQHPLAPTRSLGVLAVCQRGDVIDTLRYQQENIQQVDWQGRGGFCLLSEGLAWWQHVFVKSRLSVVSETLIFIVPTKALLSGMHAILNGTQGKQTKT